MLHSFGRRSAALLWSRLSLSRDVMPCFQLFLNFSHNCSPGHNTNGLPKQKYLCLVGVSGFGCDRDLWILHFRFYGRKTEHYLQKEKNNPFGVLLLIRCCWCGSRTLRPPRVEAKLWLFSAHSLKPTCCKGVVLSFQWDHTVAFAVIKKFQSFSFCRLLFSPDWRWCCGTDPCIILTAVSLK